VYEGTVRYPFAINEFPRRRAGRHVRSFDNLMVQAFELVEGRHISLNFDLYFSWQISGCGLALSTLTEYTASGYKSALQGP